MCSTAEECMESQIFGELRTNSMVSVVLQAFTDDVEVGERWFDCTGLLGSGRLDTGMLEGSSGSLIISIRGIHMGVVGDGGGSCDSGYGRPEYGWGSDYDRVANTKWRSHGAALLHASHAAIILFHPKFCYSYFLV